MAYTNLFKLYLLDMLMIRGVNVLNQRRLNNENTLLFIRPNDDYSDDICCVECDTVIEGNLDITSEVGSPMCSDTWRDGLKIFNDKYSNASPKELDNYFETLCDNLRNHYESKKPLSEFVLN